MDIDIKYLLFFGFVREICRDNNVELLPEDIIQLCILWSSFGHNFSKKLSNKDIEIVAKDSNIYGKCYQISTNSRGTMKLSAQPLCWRSSAAPTATKK